MTVAHSSCTTIGTPCTWPEDVNLAHHLVIRHVENGQGRRTAIMYEDREITYEELSSLIPRAANLLDATGIGKEDSVVLLIPDTPAFVTAFFAILHVGAVAVPLNPLLSCNDVTDLVLAVGPKAVFVDADFEDKFRDLQKIISNLFVTGDCCDRQDQFESLLANTIETTSPPTRARDAIAYCLFSSGTTGRPKGIPHRHTDILHCIEAYSVPILGMCQEDRVLAVPKLTFGYGLGGNLLSSLYVGAASILIPETISRVALLRNASRYSPTLFLGQPRMIADLIRNGSTHELSTLRLAVSAGEVLAPALYDLWRSTRDVELLDSFGSTEVGHVFISNHIGDVQASCAGRVVHGFEVKILDDAGQPVPLGAIGHLWVRGPSLALEYWNDRERTEQSFVNGWAKTGDLFRQDERGYLYACGRADDMIKAGCGQWVSPIELENTLQEHPHVLEVAVVGYSDELGIVRPKAIVVLRAGIRPSTALERELRSCVSATYQDFPYKHLGAVEFASSLPRSSTGKLQRFLLKPATLTEFSYNC